MGINEHIKCTQFPCKDANHRSYAIPDKALDPEKISIIMISEATPPNLNDYYYSRGSPLFQRTTVQAFRDAGANVASIKDVIKIGVYLTTAIKCGKTGYSIQTSTIEECSRILEEELSQFPNVRAFMLMGDVAIKAINFIAKRAGERRVIPAGPTYKIRKGEYYFQGRRAFPSYLQAGPSFFIEKVKRKMIAEDIAAALTVVLQFKPNNISRFNAAGKVRVHPPDCGTLR